jgi:hypothetical protein
MRRFFAIGIVLLLVAGHSAGLQVLAWSAMVISRSQDMPFTQAVTSVLEGKRPCVICRALDQDTGSKLTRVPQRGEPLGKSIVKAPDFQRPAPLELVTISAGEFIMQWDSSGTCPVGWVGTVPTPPPRARAI